MEHKTTSDFYREIFGTKVYKISINGGCNCPNRDGTKGWGGCTFCSESGSGDFTTRADFSVKKQIEEAKTLVEKKFPKNGNKKYIVYFQNFTNTYGDLKILEEKWKQALSFSEVVGLAIATRPDCLGDEVLKILNELSKITFVQLELGLQTCNEKSALRINRCYKNEEYENCLKRLKLFCPFCHIVTHIIFGLPGETKQDMLSSVDFAVGCKTDGIKITVLYVTKGTAISEQYLQGKFHVLEMDDYLDLVKLALQRIPPQVIIHRLTGDPPKKKVIAPLWTCNKKLVLNKINILLGKQ